MTIQEVDNLISINQSKIRELTRTLYPGRFIPYSRVTMLNTARRKDKKYRKNLAILYALKVAIAESNPDNEQIKTLEESLRL